MKDSTLNRCKAWIHWVFKEERNIDEEDPFYEDRLLMAQDMEKFIAVAEAAKNYEKYSSANNQVALAKALEELEKE